MTRCPKCFLDVYSPCGANHANDNKKPIVLTCDNELLRPQHYARMAISCANLSFSRRSFVDEVVNTIYLCPDEIRWPEGPLFHFCDTAIEDAFNDDLSFRWLSSFFQVKVTPFRKPQRRLLPRLRLIDLYFQIKHPNVWRHFYR